MDIAISTSCVVRTHDDSPNVLLVFSAVDIPKGHFLGFNNVFFTDVFDANIIFVNDYSKQWYLNGIIGLGDSVDETLERLRELIDTYRKPEGVVVVYGNSMGAFGALMYGCRLNVDIAITPGVELLVNNPIGIARHFLKNPPKRPPLRKIISESKTFCHLVAGEMFLGDVIGLYRVADLPNVHIETVKNFEHGVSAYIQLTKKPNIFINDYIDLAKSDSRVPIDLIEPSYAGNMAEEKLIGIYLYTTRIMILYGKGDSSKRIRKLLTLIPKTRDSALISYMNFAIAILYMRLKNKLASILYATKAYHQNRGCSQIAQYLSSIFYKDKDYEQCYAWSIKAIKIRERFPVTLYKDNKCYYECVNSLCALGFPEAGAEIAEKYLARKNIPEEDLLTAALEHCQEAIRKKS